MYHSPDGGGEALDVLLLDASCRQALVAARSLGRAGFRIGAADVRSRAGSSAFASRWTSFSAVMPDYVGGSHEFGNSLLGLLSSIRVSVIVPGLDGTLGLLLDMRPELEALGVTLAAGSDEAVRNALDKRRTLSRARAVGISVPDTVEVGPADDVRAGVHGARFPVVVKAARTWSESASTWAPRARVVVNEADLVASVSRIVEQGNEAIVQPWLSGRREAVQLMRAHGRVLAAVGVRAIRTTPPVGGAAVYRETVPLPADLFRLATQLVDVLDLDGYAEVEFRRDADGNAMLMEVNPRLSGSVIVAVQAGVDFPGMLYRWARGEPLIDQFGYRYGTRSRWLRGDLMWLAQSLRSQGEPDSPRPAAALAGYMSAFSAPSGCDYLRADDPKPAWVAARQFAQQLCDGSIARRAKRFR